MYDTDLIIDNNIVPTLRTVNYGETTWNYRASRERNFKLSSVPKCIVFLRITERFSAD